MPSIYDSELIRQKVLNDKNNTSLDAVFDELKSAAIDQTYKALANSVTVPIPDASVSSTHQNAVCYALLQSYYEQIKDLEQAEYFGKRFEKEIALLINAAMATPTIINAPPTIAAIANYNDDLIPDE